MEKPKKNRVWLRVPAIVLAVIVLAVGGFAAYSHIVYHRSALATVVELVLRITDDGHRFSVEQTEADLAAILSEPESDYELPGQKFRSKVELIDGDGCRMIEFTGSDTPGATILYIHGGAYVSNISSYQLDFCDKLAAETNARIIAPLYPLAPKHTYEETYEIVEALYLSVRQEGKTILLGDSAGGGFAAAFCEYLAESRLPQPDRLILLSPWVDASMSGDAYQEYQASDPMLGVESLTVMGKSWAGDTDTKDYKISPLFGSVSGLPETMIFVGTREIFYEDVLSFYEKLIGAGVEAELIVGEGMNHVYPILPIPEADTAIAQMAEAINR